MEEIKRYNLDPEAFKGTDRIKFNLTEDKEYGVYVKYSDHKAVVEGNEYEYVCPYCEGTGNVDV